MRDRRLSYLVRAAVFVQVAGLPACSGQNAIAGKQALAGAGTVLTLTAIEAVARKAEARHPSRTADPAPTLRVSVPTPFDAPAAVSLLADRDVSACWPAGRPHGEEAVEVTFDPTGTVVRAHVLAPGRGPALDEECVRRALESVRVDEFDGDAASVLVTYR
jgi:hypothetical protein